MYVCPSVPASFSKAQMLSCPYNSTYPSNIPISVNLRKYVPPVCSYLFYADFFHRTCQVGYIQYIHTLTYNTLLSSLWLLRTHQTVWESESDTNYAEKVGTWCQIQHIIELLMCSWRLCVCSYVCKGMRILEASSSMVFSGWLGQRLPLNKFKRYLETITTGQIYNKIRLKSSSTNCSALYFVAFLFALH